VIHTNEDQIKDGNDDFTDESYLRIGAIYKCEIWYTDISIEVICPPQPVFAILIHKFKQGTYRKIAIFQKYVEMGS